MTTSSSHAPSNPLETGAGREPGYYAALVTALIAGLFCLGVSAVLIFQRTHIRAEDPLKSARLTVLKEQLQAAPNDESLKEQIRKLDLQVRRQYFQYLIRTDTGAWLLLAGLVVLLLAGKQAAEYRKRLPMPEAGADEAAAASHQAKLARRSVGLVGLITGGALLALAFGVRSPLPNRWQDLQAMAQPDAPGDAETKPVPDWPSPEEVQANWARFRGPGGTAFITDTNYPLSWDLESGAGIVWKTPVPASGFGSPVVWGNRVFLSGGNAEKQEVLCYDVTDGKLLWQEAVQGVPPAPESAPEIPEMTGYAAATVATDGRRVYAFFANGCLAAFTVEGQQAWMKNLGFPDNAYGHASSLLTWRDRVILQLDHGDPEKNQAKLYALDAATGQIVWQRARAVPSSWPTPIVIPVGDQHQIITLADPWVIAYNAEDGTEIWRAECMAGEVTPSPVFVGGVLFLVSPMDQLLAMRPDGQGDVSQTHVLWTAHDNIPDITSPVSDGALVFLLDTMGIVTCYDAKNGEKLWEHDFEKDCHASPTIVGDRLYILTVEGSCIVVRVGREFAELARSRLGETVSASPAFAHRSIFIRGQKHLFRLGAPESELAQQ